MGLSKVLTCRQSLCLWQVTIFAAGTGRSTCVMKICNEEPRNMHVYIPIIKTFGLLIPLYFALSIVLCTSWIGG